MASFSYKSLIETERHRYVAEAVNNAEKALSESLSVMFKAGMMTYKESDALTAEIHHVWRTMLGYMQRDLDRSRAITSLERMRDERV
jgi:hypothetical protein